MVLLMIHSLEAEAARHRVPLCYWDAKTRFQNAHHPVNGPSLAVRLSLKCAVILFNLEVLSWSCCQSDTAALKASGHVSRTTGPGLGRSPQLTVWAAEVATVSSRHLSYLQLYAYRLSKRAQGRVGPLCHVFVDTEYMEQA